MPQKNKYKKNRKKDFYKMFATRTDSFDLYVDTEKFISDLLAADLLKHGVLCPKCNDYLEDLYCFGCDIKYKLESLQPTQETK